MTIIIQGEAMTKKNHSRIVRVGARTMLIPSKQYLEYEKNCGKYLALHNYHVDSPINLKVVFYRSTKRKVDLPNLLNAICDILVHYDVLADDNCSIVASFDGSCVRYDKNNPRTEITITEGKQWLDE